MTQAQFADAIGISPRTYHHVERGTRNISSDVVLRLHDLFGVDPTWLLLGLGLPRAGEEGEALADFVMQLGNLEEDLPPESTAEIVRRWFEELKRGRKLEIEDVQIWIDFLRR